ncbi:hypothetical protein L195_g047856, partial [Trifolium pratense]
MFKTVVAILEFAHYEQEWEYNAQEFAGMGTASTFCASCTRSCAPCAKSSINAVMFSLQPSQERESAVFKCFSSTLRLDTRKVVSRVKVRVILTQQKCVEALLGMANMPTTLSQVEKNEMNDK